MGVINLTHPPLADKTKDHPLIIEDVPCVKNRFPCFRHKFNNSKGNSISNLYTRYGNIIPPTAMQSSVNKSFKLFLDADFQCQDESHLIFFHLLIKPIGGKENKIPRADLEFTRSNFQRPTSDTLKQNIFHGLNYRFLGGDCPLFP